MLHGSETVKPANGRPHRSKRLTTQRAQRNLGSQAHRITYHPDIGPGEFIECARDRLVQLPVEIRQILCLAEHVVERVQLILSLEGLSLILGQLYRRSRRLDQLARGAPSAGGGVLKGLPGSSSFRGRAELLEGRP